jgi:hypothetical protein
MDRQYLVFFSRTNANPPTIFVALVVFVGAAWASNETGLPDLLEN